MLTCNSALEISSITTQVLLEQLEALEFQPDTIKEPIVYKFSNILPTEERRLTGMLVISYRPLPNILGL